MAFGLGESTRELPSFDGTTAWLNSEPLTPAGLRGQVVLVEFCTYSCVNWLRTVPYVRAWDERYRDDGLVVIGAHTHLSSSSSTTSRRSAPPSRRWASTIRSRSTTTTRVWRAFDNNVLARPLLRGRRGADTASPLRRGGLRAVGEGHPAAADRSRGHRGGWRAWCRLMPAGSTRPPTGTPWAPRRPTSATPGRRALRLPAVWCATAVTSTRSLLDAGPQQVVALGRLDRRRTAHGAE